jgi:hypothetical protein
MVFNRIIIWGLKNKYHTHRYIHKAFYENAKKLGYDVIWVEDEKVNSKFIKYGDLIISSEVIGKMVPEKKCLDDYNLPVIDGVYYCLHNFNYIFTSKIKFDYLLNLKVYIKDRAEKSDIKWGEATYFDSEKHILYQPWGTDLLPDEFKKPVFNHNKIVFWIGSIWNNELNQGNLVEIKKLKEALNRKGIKFLQLRFIPDFLNIFLIRFSRIAPAIAGRYQVEENYLPCRMFKNISYGQLGFSNVSKFNDIFENCSVYNSDIEKAVEYVLSLSKKDYKELIIKQQEIVKQYTYKNSFDNIIKAFNFINSNKEINK